MAGRPPKWKPEQRNEFQAAIDQYFVDCDNTTITKKQVTGKGDIIDVPMSRPYTMAGLAEAVGMSREILNQYKNGVFADIIARARERIERQNVELGLLGCHDARLATLNLASNYGYSTKQEMSIAHSTAEISDAELSARIDRLLQTKGLVSRDIPKLLEHKG